MQTALSSGALGASIGHLIAEGGFHAAMKRATASSTLVSLSLFGSTSGTSARSAAPWYRLKRLSFVINAGCDPEAVDGIRQEQHLDPARGSPRAEANSQGGQDPSRSRSRSPFGSV